MPNAEPSAAVTTASRVARARVLLVDDHALLRRGVANIINQDPALEVVAEAANGVDAVAAFTTHRPDVVLMDINLPRLGGIEATRQIKRAWPHIVVIGLSVQTSPQTVEAFLQAGGAALLSKEQATDELYRVIQQLARVPGQDTQLS